MKIRHLFSAALASALLIAGCTKPVDLGPAEVSILSPAESTIEVPTEGTEFTVTLKATIDWALQGYDTEVSSWILVTPESGKAAAEEQVITVKVLANDDIDRSADLVFYGNVLCKAPLTITQKGAKGDGSNISIAEFLERKDTEKEYILTGVIGDISNGEKYWGFSLKDETGVVSCPFPENFTEYSASLHTGDQVSIKGKYSYYESKQQDQCANGLIQSHTPASLDNIQTVTVAQFLEKADKFSMYRMVGEVSGSVNASYCAFDLKDETGSVYVYSVNNASDYGSKLKAGDKVTLRGAYTYFANGGKHEVVDCTIESYEEGQSGGGDTPSDNLYSIDFLAGQGDFTIDNKTVPEGASVWSYDSKYGMKASGYINGANCDTEAWLVSPVIDLGNASKAYLTIEHCTNYFADVATAAQQAVVMIKAEDGEWTKVEGVKYPEKMSWSFVSSGAADICSYAGKKVQIAFVYKSTTEKAGTWEIKNVTISETQPSTPDIPDNAITWTITPEAQGWEAATDDTYGAGFKGSAGGITVGYYKYKSTSNSVAPSSDHFRVYKSSVLKIESEKTITKVILYCTASDKCANLTVLEGAGNGFTANTANLTIEWTGSAKTIVAQASNGQVRINKIVFVCE